MEKQETRIVLTADNKTKAAFAKVKKDIKQTNKATKNLVSTTKLLAGAYVAWRGIANVIDIHRQFGAAIADLSAITGAAGKDLEFLRQKSLEFGATTTLSATQAAEAFKLIASAKPDLLENGAALAAVTKEAITLAEASGATLPDAARTLGVALNQYGAGAESAARFMNVLAAGSKRGASEVADTAEAIKVAGLVAAGSNTSFEEMNAAIQVMSTVALKGSEAGTGLRNVYLNLANQSNAKFKPAVVGFTQAMINLKKAGLDDVEMLGIFGKKNIVAAKALVNNAGALKNMRKQLTDTTVGYEQAAIKADTLDGDLKKMGSTWESVALMLGDTFDPALRSTVQLFTFMAKAAKTVILTFRDIGSKIGALAAQAVALSKWDLAGITAIGKARDENAKKLENEYNILWNINGAQDALNKKVAAQAATKTSGNKGAAIERAKLEAQAIAAAKLSEQQKAWAAEDLATRENYAKALLTMQESIFTQEETLKAAYDNRAFIVEDAFQVGLISEMRRKEILIQLEQKHEDDKLKIAAKAAKEKLGIQTRGLSAAAGIFDGLSALMSKSGKEQTKESQFLARASIVASTAAAIMNALAVTPYPLGVALAAGAALKGAAQLQAVGGSGGGSIRTPAGTAGSGSYSGVAPPPSSNGLGPQQSAGTTTINLVGKDRTFTGDEIDSLFDEMSAAIDRGDKILFSSESRQALELG